MRHMRVRWNEEVPFRLQPPCCFFQLCSLCPGRRLHFHAPGICDNVCRGHLPNVSLLFAGQTLWVRQIYSAERIPWLAML